MPQRRYLRKDGKDLRLGFTTGSAAALAAAAATRLLLTGSAPEAVSLVTPAGLAFAVEVAYSRFDGDAALCAVRKDAGDDPDVTDGVLVQAAARKNATGEVTVDGGPGVGRVTRPGLDQPVGEAAINSVPRSMIREQVRKACAEAGYAGGVDVVVSIPDGLRLAARTFNPHLGIVGGLSVIGTSGIVEPMSDKACVGAIAAEMDVHRAEGATALILTPGNYGAAFLAGDPRLAGPPVVKCANFIGAALELAAEKGFAAVLAVGHLGKMIKVAGGILDTHSRVADCRLELLALHAALAGAAPARLREILGMATVDAGLEVVEELGLRGPVMQGILERIERHLARRAGGSTVAGAAAYSHRHGMLGMGERAKAIVRRWTGGSPDARAGAP